MHRHRFSIVGTSLLAVSLLVSAAFVLWLPRHVGAARRGGFDERSLDGSFGSVGRAGASASVSVGVAVFDGRGNVTRVVRVNAGAEDGGRRLLDLTSTGSYVVEEDGRGVISFLNTFPDGSIAEAVFDFVITKTTERGRPRAAEIFAIDRAPGVTASPVTESYTLRTGL